MCQQSQAQWPKKQTRQNAEGPTTEMTTPQLALQKPALNHETEQPQFISQNKRNRE